MIKLTGIESYLEAIYLEERLTERTALADIEVNPQGSVDYIMGKTIIINCNDYSKDQMKILVGGYNNKVYSRVVGYEGVKHYPYIMRPNFDIMWNGEVLYCPSNISESKDEILEWIEKGRYDKKADTINSDTRMVATDYPQIQFPKVYGISPSLLYDKDGNLTILGWALHQVGVNLVPMFKNMDLLKTKKII